MSDLGNLSGRFGEHRVAHRYDESCRQFGCLMRFRQGVLMEITEAYENEPRPEAKAALARLQETIRTMPVPPWEPERGEGRS